MHRSLWLIVGLTTLAASAACSPQTVNVEQERTALMARDREWSQTTKDPEKFVSYMAEGASLYPPGMPIMTGTETIRKAFAEMHKAPGFSLSWTPTKAEVSASGDIAHTAGTYESAMGGVTEKGKILHGVEEAGRRLVEGDR